VIARTRERVEAAATSSKKDQFLAILCGYLLWTASNI